MDGLFLLALAIPIGLFIGWCLGISAWRQVRSLRAEVAALRRALEEAGVAIAATAPQPLPHPTTWATPVPTRGPNPWRTPQPETAAPPPEAEPAAPSTLRRPGMEEALTLRWGIWLGAGALLLAGIFLVRTAVEEGWLGPAERCLLAALLGLALVGGAEWLRRRAAQEDIWLPWSDHAPQALAAGGVAVLFGAAYATAVLYALVPPLVGFALMAAVALAGIALALLQGPVVAAVGILGAFVTPLLVDSPNPFLPGLFGYLLLVTAAALAVLRQVGAGWLGWAAMAGAAIWIVLGGMMAADAAGLWAPALFLPAVAALQLALLPQVAADGVEGRRLTWIPFAVLAAAGLTLLLHADPGLAPGIGLLLLSPVAIAKAAAEPRLNPLPHLAAFAGLLMLLAWPIGAWSAGGEVVTLEGVVLAVLPGAPWPDAALWPFLGLALALALIHAAAGLLLERRAPRPLAWASLTAAVPVLVLLVAYARVRGFALDWGWAVGALGLAAALVGCAALARREGALQRAGVHAAGAVAALALGAAMVLTTSWLTMAVALLLPPLAWIEARAGLPALRRVPAGEPRRARLRLRRAARAERVAAGLWRAGPAVRAGRLPVPPARRRLAGGGSGGRCDRLRDRADGAADPPRRDRRRDRRCQLALLGSEPSGYRPAGAFHCLAACRSPPGPADVGLGLACARLPGPARGGASDPVEPGARARDGGGHHAGAERAGGGLCAAGDPGRTRRAVARKPSPGLAAPGSRGLCAGRCAGLGHAGRPPRLPPGGDGARSRGNRQCRALCL